MLALNKEDNQKITVVITLFWHFRKMVIHHHQRATHLPQPLLTSSTTAPALIPSPMPHATATSLPHTSTTATHADAYPKEAISDLIVGWLGLGYVFLGSFLVLIN
jgi:hypothetical protein